MSLDNVLDDRIELRRLGAVHQVWFVVAHHGAVGGNRHHAELVDLLEFGGLGHGRSGHPAKLLVHAEIVLQGDRRKGLILLLDFDALLRLNRLVHTLVVSTTGEDAAGVLIDDQHFAFHHDVVAITFEEFLGLDRVVEEAHQGCVDGFVEIVDAKPVFASFDAALQHADRALFLVNFVVAVDA